MLVAFSQSGIERERDGETNREKMKKEEREKTKRIMIRIRKNFPRLVGYTDP